MKPKTLYIFGWKYGGEYHQYIQFRTKQTTADQVPPGCARCDWWPTRHPENATRFKSIDAVIKCFRTINPGGENTENRIYNGFLNILEDGPFGLRLIPRLTRQPSIFDGPPCNAPIERQPNLISVPASAPFSRDEAKILSAGFSLVRYNRESKTVQCSYSGTAHVWLPAIVFNTYAAAERTLKDVLQLKQAIEVSLEGKVNLTTSAKKLSKVGFDFYRSEGIVHGHGHDVPRIKQWSKNWGAWAKYETPEQLKAAWGELMKDPKALHG